MSLKPGTRVADSPQDWSSGKGLGSGLDSRRSQNRPGLLQLSYIQDQLGTPEGREVKEEDRSQTSSLSNGQDPTLCYSPPKTENEVMNRGIRGRRRDWRGERVGGMTGGVERDGRRKLSLSLLLPSPIHPPSIPEKNFCN